jgi:tannase/feruloyl esterase
MVRGNRPNGHERARATRRPLAALALTAAAAAAQTPAHAQDSCAALADFSLPTVALEITSTERLAAGAAPQQPRPGGPGYSGTLPARCQVEGVIDKRIGAGEVEYGINFALALPEDWNGRFLFQGGGGLNGSVQLPLGSGVAGETPALVRGFAVVSNDTGHSGAVFDSGFFADQEAALNFLYVANGKVAVVAKALIAAFYARPPDRSYFVGCSTGGREGMIFSQRYPSYFDGIVAGAPAMRTGYSNLGIRWVSVALGKAAEKDASGSLIPGNALSADDRQLIVDSLLKTCDADDGLEDGMIFNSHACDFDPTDLVCSGAKTGACLSAEQANAVQVALSGPKASNGRQVYPGYLYDTGIGFTGPGIPGVLNGAASPVAPAPATEQDVDAEAAEVAVDVSTLGDTNWWTNLSTFSGHGRKLLLYHGVSDPWFSSLDTIEYYQELGDANGGAAAVRDWSRLFLVPGMGHCGGGTAALDRFDLLSALVDWVEHDRAPDSVVATGAAFPGRSRPLCPYPQHTHYKGSGDPEDAANFECR